jgi:hypothetical protein
MNNGAAVLSAAPFVLSAGQLAVFDAVRLIGGGT